MDATYFLQGDRGSAGEKGKKGDKGATGEPGLTGHLVRDFVVKLIMNGWFLRQQIPFIFFESHFASALHQVCTICESRV